MLAGNAAYNPGATFLIDSVTVGAGGASTVSFSSIPTTYQHLQLRVSVRCSATGSSVSPGIQLNGDTASNYGQHYIDGNGTSATAGANTPSSNFMYLAATGSSAAANIFGVNVLDILDYANTNKYKTGRSLTGIDFNGSGFIDFSSHAWRSTAALSSILITAPSSGTFVQYSKFSLYGYMGS